MQFQQNQAPSPNRRTQRAALACLATYVVVTHFTMGLRAEHLVLGGIALALALKGGKALRFLIYAAPVVLTGITYDFVRLLTRFRGEIHVADIYHAELALFGIGDQVPALWFENHTHPALDLVCGVAYIIYLYVPMAVALALFFLDRERGAVVGLAFLCTNLIGIAIYLLFPAAPPWYVADYGLGPADMTAVPNAAGAARFDDLLGIDYFRSFYERSANVFGAVPSLHTAYPLSTALATWRMGNRWRVPLVGIASLVGFSAVYLQHHYILDVIAGIACAAAGYVVAEALARKGPASGQASEPAALVEEPLIETEASRA